MVNEKISYDDIGRRLRQIRGDETLEAFGAALDVSKSYVSNTENGEKPSIEYLLKVADRHNISLDWILTGVSALRSDHLAANLKQVTVRFNGRDYETLEKLTEVMRQRTGFGWDVATIVQVCAMSGVTRFLGVNLTCRQEG